MSEVFFDLTTLAVRIDQDRSRGRTIVFANGHFDLMHVGHIRYLQGAAREGQVLVVGINGDNATRELKGEGRPIIPAIERAEMVAALTCVGYVTIVEELDMESTLRALRPDIHAKGTDYTSANVPEAGVMKELGGKVAIVGDPKDHATTDLIARVKALP